LRPIKKRLLSAPTGPRTPLGHQRVTGAGAPAVNPAKAAART